MQRIRDLSFLLFLLFVWAFSSKAQTTSTQQIVLKCASGSRLSAAGPTPPSETIMFRKCSDGKNYISSGGGAFEEFGDTNGTVTSVGFSAPALFSVTGSPITTAGTITVAWQSQAANLVLASPDGTSGTPTARALVEADIPATFVTAPEGIAMYALLSGGNTFAGITTGPGVSLSGNAPIVMTGSQASISHTGTGSTLDVNTQGTAFRFGRSSAVGTDTRIHSPNTTTVDLEVDGVTGDVTARTEVRIGSRVQTGSISGTPLSTAPAAEFRGAKVATALVATVIDTTSMAAGVGGGIAFMGQYTTGPAYRYFGGIESKKENGTTSNSLAGLSFLTNNNSSTPAEAMYITGSRDVGIGTAAPLTLSSGFALTSSRALTVFSSNAAHLVIDGTSSVLNFGDSNGSTNQKHLQIAFDANVLTLRAMNDAGTLKTTGWTWTESTNTHAFTNINVSGTCTGCSGTGDSNNVGTWASRPAGGVNTGNTYQPTDAPYTLIDDGSALVYFGPRFRFFLPDLASYTAINQGTATADQTNGAIWIEGPQSTTTNVRSWVKTAPATPYTITVAVQAQFVTQTQFAGFTWRESSTSKLVSCGLAQFGGNFYFATSYWTNDTTFSSAPAENPSATSVYHWNRAGVNWIKANDNGTNLTCSWSVDGIHFTQWFTATRTTHTAGGPNQVGLFVNTEAATGTVRANFLSWQQQ